MRDEMGIIVGGMEDVEIPFAESLHACLTVSGRDPKRSFNLRRPSQPLQAHGIHRLFRSQPNIVILGEQRCEHQIAEIIIITEPQAQLQGYVLIDAKVFDQFSIVTGDAPIALEIEYLMIVQYLERSHNRPPNTNLRFGEMSSRGFKVVLLAQDEGRRISFRQ
jgi:hypothetical protein